MNVVLTVGGEVEVDNQTDLLDINSTCEQVGGDEHATASTAEFAHDDVALPLVHVSVHATDGEVALLHVLLQPVDLATCVAVDDGLGDGEGLVQIAKGVEFPLFPLDGNVELLDTLEGEFVLCVKLS